MAKRKVRWVDVDGDGSMLVLIEYGHHMKRNCAHIRRISDSAWEAVSYISTGLCRHGYLDSCAYARQVIEDHVSGELDINPEVEVWIYGSNAS